MQDPAAAVGNPSILRGLAIRPALTASLTRLAIAVCVVALIAPVLVAEIPPLVDYPNHLARLWLLAGGAASPPLSGFYRVSWDTLTNIGMDVLGVLLLRIPLALTTAGRILVALAIVLGPVGGIVLWRSIHGRLHWWCLSFPLLAWGLGLLFGFLNFQIAIGLALLAGAADPALARRGPWVQLAARMVFSTLLTLVHVLAIPLYASILGAMVIGPRLGRLRSPQRLRMLTSGLGIVAVAVSTPVLLLMLAAPATPGAQVGFTAKSALFEFTIGLWMSLTHLPVKVPELMFAIRSYDAWLDILTYAALCTPVILAIGAKRLTVHAGMLTASALLALVFVLLPPMMAGTGYVDDRFAIMAAFPLLIAFKLDLPAPLGLTSACALALVSLLRTGDIGWIWSQRQADFASIARAVEPIPAGAAVFPLQHLWNHRGDAPPGRYLPIGPVMPFNHEAALAVPWQHAFIPTLFAARGKQPLLVLPPWADLSDPDGGLLASVHALDTPAVLARSLADAPYLRSWRQRFDYALVLNADLPDENGPFNPPPGLTLVRDAGFAQLYRIDHGQAGSQP